MSDILRRISQTRGVPRGAAGGTFNPASLVGGAYNTVTRGPIGLGLLGGGVLAPIVSGAAGYLRSDQGQLLKDRLRQGDLPGAFTAVTGIGRQEPKIRFQTSAPLYPSSSSQDRSKRQASAPSAPDLPPPPRTTTLTGGPQPPGAGLGNLAATQPGSAPATVTTYDMTPQGQFQRYFTDNQMGQYFGGAPSAQAPKSAAAMQEAAMLQRAPTTMPLADYYRSQSATGRANMDQIIGLMGYTGDMEKWARANPMLAQRAYAAQFQGGGPATQGAPGAQPVLDEALNPSSPAFSGVGGSGERIYNFAADDVDAAKIKAFQELVNKQRQ